MAPAKKKTTSKAARDAAAEAALRARKDGESEADYKARIDALDAEEEDEDAADVDPDGLVSVRAISGFSHHTGVTQQQVDLQRPLRPGESPEQHQARMRELDKIDAVEAVVVRRGQRISVPPDEAAKLARLGLVLIGDSDEYLGDAGPKVLQEAGLVRQTNG